MAGDGLGGNKKSSAIVERLRQAAARLLKSISTEGGGKTAESPFDERDTITRLTEIIKKKLAEMPSAPDDSEVERAADVKLIAAVKESEKVAIQQVQKRTEMRGYVVESLREKACDEAIKKTFESQVARLDERGASVVRGGWTEHEKRARGMTTEMRYVEGMAGSIQAYISQGSLNLQPKPTSKELAALKDVLMTALVAAREETLKTLVLSEEDIDAELETRMKNFHFPKQVTDADRSDFIEAARRALQEEIEQRRQPFIDIQSKLEKNGLPWNSMAARWAGAARRAQPAITPDSIRFIRPHSGSGFVTRGSSARITVEEATGDIIATLPANKVFESVHLVNYLPRRDAYTERTPIETYKITEADTESGQGDEYLIIVGQEKGGEPIIVIKCKETGAEREFAYGDAPALASYMVGTVRKPVLAFRNFTADTAFTARVEFAGSFDAIYPEPTTQDRHVGAEVLEWKGIARPDNSVVVGERSYPYLFWDGAAEGLGEKIVFNEGFCVPGAESVRFLEEVCEKFGFDTNLTADFVTFWVPYLKQHEFNLVKFLSLAECDSIARLKVDIPELRVVRLYMAFRPVAAPEEIREQILAIEPVRGRKTLFEWGGFEVPLQSVRSNIGIEGLMNVAAAR